ncbi:MAG: mercuric ion transport protein [Gammaproteobacteria bacterium]
MTERGLLTTGAIGTLVVALCCFTPLLVIVLATLGLSAWLGWLDLVLLPMLGVFVCITVYALVRFARRRARVVDMKDT